jgi:hypothetical protein
VEKKNKGHNGGEEISTTVENNHNGGEENVPQRWKTTTTVAKKMSHNGGNYHNCGKENIHNGGKETSTKVEKKYVLTRNLVRGFQFQHRRLNIL